MYGDHKRANKFDKCIEY